MCVNNNKKCTPKRRKGGQYKTHKSKSLEPRLLWSSSATCRVEKIFPLLLNAESKAGSASFYPI